MAGEELPLRSHTLSVRAFGLMLQPAHWGRGSQSRARWVLALPPTWWRCLAPSLTSTLARGGATPDLPLPSLRGRAEGSCQTNFWV